jgi:hypothetical protein
MLRLAALVPAFAALIAAQSVTITDGVTYSAVPTPDALPLDDLLDLPPPTFTSHAGLDSEIIAYATATAIQAAVADQTENPLSVYPAVTAIPINEAGEDDDDLVVPTTTAAPGKRGLEVRSACDPQKTMANYYSVNIDSYSAFKADPTIASVANAAPTPSGYTQNFKNLGGASNALGYLGYAMVNKGQTGYDVQWCANKCNAIAGCNSFNIYMERDPVLEPGAGCRNPAPFANIKCSFWGSGLTPETTKQNQGQYQADFQVAIAGSNGYTSWKLGGPIPDYGTPLSLNTSVMNAPLNDCAGTYTYLGYKLFQDGPYDVSLCAAACDTQTAYNLAHPPKNGKPVKCSAFGSYILTMTNKTASYQQGQMCTLYTAGYDKSYAKNFVSYDDRIGAKYTYSYSFFYSRPDRQPICKADILSLQASGADFCTSYLGYVQPVTTTTTTTTPALTVSTKFVDGEVRYATQAGVPTTTITANAQWKRQDGESASAGLASLTVEATTTFATVDSVPEYSAVILGEISQTITAANGTVPTDAPDNIVAPTGAPDSAAARRALYVRAVATPANVAGWAATRISEACSAVATGTSTSVSVTVAPTPVTTTTATNVATTTLQACVVPTTAAGYKDFIPIWGRWSDGQIQDNQYSVSGSEASVQLPFPVTISGQTSNSIRVGTNGYIAIGSAHLYAFAGQGSGLYIYGGRNGVFYRIAGDVGSRTVVVSWYAGTYNYGHQQNHFTVTLFENRPGYVQYKYYDVVMQPDPSAYVALGSPDSFTYFSPYGQVIPQGQQISIYAPTANVPPEFAISQHDRVDCCTTSPFWWSGWHTCTEYQAPLVDSLAPALQQVN